MLPPQATTRAGIAEACEANFQRLGTDRLDFYLLHWRGGADLQTVVDGLERSRDAGKIRGWGVSNFGVGDMRDRWQVPGGDRCTVNQVRYNLADRGIESDVMPWCHAHRVVIMAYSPLGTGSGDLIDRETLARIG